MLEPIRKSRPDILLVEDAVRGDRSAFKQLHGKYVRRILNLAYRMTRDLHEAEEITQGAFYQVYRALRGIRGSSMFYTLLHRFAVDLSVQHIKKRIIRRIHTAAHGGPDLGAIHDTAVPDPDVPAERLPLHTVLEDAIETLPVNQRVVLVLGPIQGHTSDQLAEILNMNEEIVQDRLDRAGVNLRSYLQDRRSSS